jgi:hypothetical protein
VEVAVGVSVGGEDVEAAVGVSVGGEDVEAAVGVSVGGRGVAVGVLTGCVGVGVGSRGVPVGDAGPGVADGAAVDVWATGIADGVGHGSATWGGKSTRMMIRPPPMTSSAARATAPISFQVQLGSPFSPTGAVPVEAEMGVTAATGGTASRGRESVPASHASADACPTAPLSAVASSPAVW